MTAEQKDLINWLSSSIRESTRIIEMVRRLKQIKHDETKYRNIDLDYVLKETIGMFEETIEKEFEIRYDRTDVEVYANDFLGDIFSNLIENSIKFSRKRILIDIKVKEYNKGVRVEVEDNGPGIPDHLKPHIFKRLEINREKVQGSGGYGLYLIKVILNNYGGDVRHEDRVSGESGQGSRFIVDLPKGKAEPGTPAI